MEKEKSEWMEEKSEWMKKEKAEWTEKEKERKKDEETDRDAESISGDALQGDVVKLPCDPLPALQRGH